MFKDNLRLLLRDGEQGYGILEYVNHAIDAVNTETSCDTDAYAYLEIYNDALDFVRVRRAYASAKLELAECLLIFGYSDGCAPVKDFETALESVTTVEDVNNVLNNTICALIGLRIEKETGYVGELRKGLISDCDAETARANGIVTGMDKKAVIADLSACIADIDIREYRARAKDKTVALVADGDISSAMKNIIDGYLKSGGIFDLCDDEKSLDIEYFRAEIRVLWYREYREYEKSIDYALRPTNDTEILRRAEEVYRTADGAAAALDIKLLNIIILCEKIIADARIEIKALEARAMAVRYAHDHRSLLEKRTEDIGLSDEAALTSAIEAYSSLSEAVKIFLENERTEINEKYKRLAAIKISSFAVGDGLEALTDKVYSLSDSDEPSRVKADADEITARAQVFALLNSKYAEIRGDSDFSLYGAESKSAISEAYAKASNAIIDGEPSDGRELSKWLYEKLFEAELALEKHAAIAKIRLAAKDCMLSDVKNTVSAAENKILGALSVADISNLRDGAVFRIECQKKAAQMRIEISSLKENISALPALGEQRKRALIAEADALYSLCDSIAMSADGNTLEGLVAELENKASELFSRSEREALSEGKRQAIYEVNAKADAIKKEIEGYSFIDYESAGMADELKISLFAIADSFKNYAELEATAWDGLEAFKKEAIASLNAVSAKAKEHELLGSRASALDSLDNALGELERYSDEKGVEVVKIADGARAEILRTESVSEVIALLKDALARIDEIPTLLDTAKEKALSSLDAAYAEFVKIKGCYSNEVWGELEEIYAHTSEEIKLISKFSDLEKANTISNERIALMRQKKRDRVYTQDGLLYEGSYYGDGYDHGSFGYSASVFAEKSIPYGASLSVIPFNGADALRTIKNAARDGRVYLNGSAFADKALLKKLRSCTVITGLDIGFDVSGDINGGAYTVTLLIPEALKRSGIEGAVFIREDGSVEYFGVSFSDNTASFEVPHFSSFYLVGERTVNLVPLIIILSLLLALEAAVLLLLLRKNKSRRNISTACVLPLAPIAYMARILPKGGVAISVILGVLVIAAGGAIAYILICERKHGGAERSHEAREKIEEKEEARKNVAECEEDDELAEEESVVALERKKLKTTVGVPILAAVTAEEADGLMSDADAREAVEEASAQAEEIAVYTSHGKKYEVNIDSISALFEHDETVSLASLKEKGLVPKSAKAVKILARGRLDKPLTVIAQDFSTAAVKMITLTGGHAVLVERE